MRRTSRHSGHTLVELLVVATLLAVVLGVVMRGFAPLTLSTVLLRDRAEGVTELRAAVESLLQDLGGAELAIPDPFGNLIITREPAVAAVQGAWSLGNDDGIVYSFSGGDLVRDDLELGTSVIVARNLTAFAVAKVGRETHIDLSAGQDMGERNVSLLWLY